MFKENTTTLMSGNECFNGSPKNYKKGEVSKRTFPVLFTKQGF